MTALKECLIQGRNYSRYVFPVPGNGFKKPLSQVNLGLKTKHLFGLFNIRNSEFYVRLVPRNTAYDAVGFAEPSDLFGEVIDGQGAAWISDVEGFTYGRIFAHTQKDPIHDVFYVAPGANL